MEPLDPATRTANALERIAAALEHLPPPVVLPPVDLPPGVPPVVIPPVSQESAEGTWLVPGGRLIDADGALWTLDAYQLARDGVVLISAAQVLYSAHRVCFNQGPGGPWYAMTLEGAVPIDDPQAPPPVVVVPPVVVPPVVVPPPVTPPPPPVVVPPVLGDKWTRLCGSNPPNAPYNRGFSLPIGLPDGRLLTLWNSAKSPVFLFDPDAKSWVNPELAAYQYPPPWDVVKTPALKQFENRGGDVWNGKVIWPQAGPGALVPDADLILDLASNVFSAFEVSMSGFDLGYGIANDTAYVFGPQSGGFSAVKTRKLPAGQPVTWSGKPPPLGQYAILGTAMYGTARAWLDHRSAIPMLINGDNDLCICLGPNADWIVIPTTGDKPIGSGHACLIERSNCVAFFSGAAHDSSGGAVVGVPNELRVLSLSSLRWRISSAKGPTFGGEDNSETLVHNRFTGRTFLVMADSQVWELEVEDRVPALAPGWNSFPAPNYVGAGGPASLGTAIKHTRGSADPLRGVSVIGGGDVAGARDTVSVSEMVKK